MSENFYRRLDSPGQRLTATQAERLSNSRLGEMVVPRPNISEAEYEKLRQEWLETVAIANNADPDNGYMTRAEFLTKAGKWLAATVLTGPKVFTSSEKSESIQSGTISPDVTSGEVIADEREVLGEQLHTMDIEYEMGELSGWRLNNLYADYTGQERKERGEPVEPTPEILKINFLDCLRNMWSRKVDRSEGNRVVVRAQAELITEYEQSAITTMTLADYIAEAESTARDLRNQFDWRVIKDQEGISDSDVDMLRMLVQKIDGSMMVAYAMTELMPTSTGNLNAAMMEFLLQNAGREFIEMIPAMGDDLTSFGPFQFTSWALYQVDEERRGASRINASLPESARIKDSVIYLRGNDHIKAAFMFAVHNLSFLLKKITDTQKQILLAAAERDFLNVAKFMATAHHQPYDSLRFAKKWLDAGAIGGYEKYVEDRFIIYSDKTSNNLDALKALTS